MLGIGEDDLSVYLNDHLAGSTAGANLARRAAGHNPALEAVAEEIEEDRSELVRVMDLLGVGRDPVKALLGWGVEKAARLKLIGEGLGRLEELEALALGVHGKLSLWEALRHTHGEDPRLAGVDLDELIARARSQRRRIETQRLRAARGALVSPAP